MFHFNLSWPFHIKVTNRLCDVQKTLNQTMFSKVLLSYSFFLLIFTYKSHDMHHVSTQHQVAGETEGNDHHHPSLIKFLVSSRKGNNFSNEISLLDTFLSRFHKFVTTEGSHIHIHTKSCKTFVYGVNNGQ